MIIHWLTILEPLETHQRMAQTSFSSLEDPQIQPPHPPHQPPPPPHFKIFADNGVWGALPHAICSALWYLVIITLPRLLSYTTDPNRASQSGVHKKSWICGGGGLDLVCIPLFTRPDLSGSLWQRHPGESKRCGNIQNSVLDDIGCILNWQKVCIV